MTDSPDIAALLGSRICHDLISPIGAISNGVELLLMDGLSRSPEMTLIGESVASANAKIRFFRVAFGMSSGDQRIGRAEVQTILTDLTQGGRFTIDWQVPSDILRREAKLAFLALQCLETALAYGGRATAQLDGTRWVIVGQATRMKIEPDLWEVLSNPKSTYPLTPAQVHFALLAEEISRQNRRLSVELRETEIRIAF